MHSPQLLVLANVNVYGKRNHLAFSLVSNMKNKMGKVKTGKNCNYSPACTKFMLHFRSLLPISFFAFLVFMFL